MVADLFALRQNQGPGPLDVLANDRFGPEYNGPRVITSVSFGSEGGSVAITEDGKFLQYAPPADFSGEETFSYFVDGALFTNVRVEVRSPLKPDEYAIRPTASVHTLDVLRNDPFWTGYTGARKITLASVSSAGSELTVASDGQSIVYRPSDELSGQDQFVYIVDDIYPAHVTITVPTTVVSDQYELLQNAENHTLNVLANDPFWSGYTAPKVVTHVTESAQQAAISISP